MDEKSELRKKYIRNLIGDGLKISSFYEDCVTKDERYEFTKKYNKGNLIRDGLKYGSVFEGYHEESRQLVAIKQINNVKRQDGGLPSHIENEIATVKMFDNPKIIRFRETIIVDNSYDSIVYLVFDSLPYNLGTLIYTRKGAQNPFSIKSLLREILLGVEYLHSQNFIHSDLTPKDVLIDSEVETVKLAYYGEGIPLVERRTPGHEKPKVWYKPPEVICRPDSAKWSTAFDMWSVGCIFAEMVIKRPLFPCSDAFPDLYLHFISLLSPANQEFHANLAPDMDLVLDFMKLSRRSLGGESDKYSTDLRKDLVRLEPAGVDLLTKMLSLHPDKRITAKDALEHEYFKSDSGSVSALT